MNNTDKDAYNVVARVHIETFAVATRLLGADTLSLALDCDLTKFLNNPSSNEHPLFTFREKIGDRSDEAIKLRNEVARVIRDKRRALIVHPVPLYE